MLTIALQFFSMRLGSADAGSDPAGSVAGHANWCLPRRLDRILPRLNVEGAADGHDLDSEAVVSTDPAHAA
jgi:hypothetical protein